MNTPLWLIAYRGLMALLKPVWTWVLYRRLAKGKESALSVAQKLMLTPHTRPAHAPIIWGHAVGVGEALALAGLFAELAKHLDTHYFLLTSSAHTSAKALSSGQLPARCIHQFAPIDTPSTVAAFLKHWRPQLAIWCEMDLWPCLMSHTYQLSIPMVLVNARLSEQSYQKKRAARFFYADLLKQFQLIYTQNDLSAQLLVQLGANARQTQVCGSIKALAQPLQCDKDTLGRLQELLQQRPCWVMASSHEGEEAIAIAAHQIVLEQCPNALLFIAPRYPHRGDLLAQQFNLLHAQRSKGFEPCNTQPIYLCDTIGEMGLWYRLSTIAVLGGSLVPVGGHNPYEALRLNCAVLHGEHVHNFSEIYADLQLNAPVCKVSQASDIAWHVVSAFNQSRSDINHQNQQTLTSFSALRVDIVRKLIDLTAHPT
jgi:3-deoxy-D-manno-octulosonic-acid transferase